MAKGWIRLHRKLMDSDQFWLTPREFSEWEAWIYLLMQANHTDKRIKTLNGNVIMIERSEHLTSTIKLASVFGWSRSKVRRFLTRLENGHQITSKATSKWTQIRITNYEKYQGVDIEGDQQPANSTPTTIVETATTKNDLLNKKLNKYPLPPNLKTEICVDVLEAWIEHRRQIKKPTTKSIIAGLLKKYADRPIDFVRDVEDSIANGYQGVFASNKSKFGKTKKTNAETAFELAFEIMAEEKSKND